MKVGDKVRVLKWEGRVNGIIGLDVMSEITNATVMSFQPSGNVRILCERGLNWYIPPSQLEILDEPKTDQIVEQVLNRFSLRSNEGIQKYGTTLYENEKDDFLTHLQEELMDAVLYIEKLKQQRDEQPR